MNRTYTLLLATLTFSAACENDSVGTSPDEPTPDRPQVGQTAGNGGGLAIDPTAAAANDEEPTELLTDASETLQQMTADPQLKELLQQSRGVFIVPRYARAAAGVGARGGEGVLIAHHDGKWSDPVFYDIGGLSVGAQLGAEGGEIAMVLMSDQALQSFKGDNTFSLNAEAKLTLIDYSKLGAGSLGKAGDVVFWSDTEGAFVGVDLAATDISWDDEENTAYYGNGTTADDVLSGKRKAPANSLQKQLSEL